MGLSLLHHGEERANRIVRETLLTPMRGLPSQVFIADYWRDIDTSLFRT